ncbi:MAG: hypothetical protein ACI8PZ_000689 [Myxococcota bacterium]|jgi:hypothetical protein
MDWRPWRTHFELNARRQMPPMDTAEVPEPLRELLAASLATFALGETGEGRIVQQVQRLQAPGIDDDYRTALSLFVAEEGRHAAILGRAVRALGGRMPRSTWSSGAFTQVRGIAGVHTKLVVLLAAEVVAVTAYAALASRLPDGDLRRALDTIVADEDAHLQFHAQFFSTVCTGPAERLAFQVAWRSAAAAAGLTVCVDHRALWRRLGVPMRELAGELTRLTLHAEQLVLSAAPMPATSPSR